MQIQPYLFLDGRCEEAIEFYRKNLGAEVTMLMRWKDCPEKDGMTTTPPDDKVMHSSIRIGDSTILASDGHSRLMGSLRDRQKCRASRCR